MGRDETLRKIQPLQEMWKHLQTIYEPTNDAQTIWYSSSKRKLDDNLISKLKFGSFFSWSSSILLGNISNKILPIVLS